MKHRGGRPLMPTHAPRVDACIEGVMNRFPGETKAAHARYYEEVHQHLAPLARQLEQELAAASEALVAARHELSERDARKS
jgi:hypothetical protein